MRMKTLAGLLAAPLMVLAMLQVAHAADAAAPTTCKDGTTSAAAGRGACSGHGGVQKAAKSKAASGTAAAPAAAPEPAAPAASTSVASTPAAATPSASGPAPAGATAKCKDGSYSKSKHHSGTCSSHGGVAQWLTAQSP